jgi:hypothetical protein
VVVEEAHMTMNGNTNTTEAESLTTDGPEGASLPIGSELAGKEVKGGNE